jgi:hypothetical protein
VLEVLISTYQQPLEFETLLHQHPPMLLDISLQELTRCSRFVHGRYKYESNVIVLIIEKYNYLFVLSVFFSCDPFNMNCFPTDEGRMIFFVVKKSEVVEIFRFPTNCIFLLCNMHYHCHQQNTNIILKQY